MSTSSTSTTTTAAAASVDAPTMEEVTFAIDPYGGAESAPYAADGNPVESGTA
jgi:hypothetical protein